MTVEAFFKVVKDSMTEGNNIYVRGFVYNEFGYASALAVVFFGITLALTLVVLTASKRFTYYAGESDN